jgi:pimeloyl-ACP methyl ester carboxylesterase
VRREADGRFGFKFDPRWFGLPPAAPPDPAQTGCPTLVLRGGESTLLTAAGAATLVSEIPGAKLVEIPGAGHNVQLERPAEVLEIATRFLRDFA